MVKSPSPTRQKRGATAVLALMCLGVVFGDIGTSPLYSMQVAFNSPIAHVEVTRNNVLGVISLTLWTLIVIPCLGYLTLMMRADNDGEGGVMALASLIEKNHGKKIAFITCLVAAGAALFFADSIITPAVSILGAIDGVNVVDKIPNEVIIPSAVVLVIVLFGIQKYGTHAIGRVFGPAMICWFLTVGVSGIPSIVQAPEVLLALSPTYAISFAISSPKLALVALGGIVLTVTGVEALYADMGHFGRRPIVLAWAALVMPALFLSYLGQGALLLRNPAAATSSPFYLLFPEHFRIPVILLAVLATFIASQAVISGVFSIARQASRLSLVPRLHIVRTSQHSMGQIFIPAINMILFVGVVLLVVVFQSADRLAAAYGFAVTLTLLIELSLLTVMMRSVWKWSLLRVVPVVLAIGGWELGLFLSTVPKIVHGAWLPALIASIVLFIMLTWNKGARVMSSVRSKMEGDLDEFLDKLHRCEGLIRTPGTAVFLQGNPRTVPLAMNSIIEFQHTLNENVILLNVRQRPVPHVKRRSKIVVNKIDHDLHIYAVTYNVGFNDPQRIVPVMKFVRKKLEPVTFSSNDLFYILSVFRIEPGGNPEMPQWCSRPFRFLEKISANRTQVFHLPPSRTVVIGAEASL